MTTAQTFPDKPRAMDGPTFVVIALFASLMTGLAAVLNIWIDEYFSLHTTSRGIGYAFSQAVGFEGQPPGYFLALWFWRQLHDSVFWARMFSVVCAVGALATTATICRRLLPEFSPVWIVFLVAFNPITTFAALDIRTAAPTLLLSALLLRYFLDVFFVSAPRRSHVLIFGALCVVALYTQYYLGFQLLAGGIAVLATRNRAAIIRYYLSMAVTGILFLPMAYWIVGHVDMHEVANYEWPTFSQNLRYMIRMVFEFVWPVKLLGFPGKTRLYFICVVALVLGVLVLVYRREVSAPYIAIWLFAGVQIVAFAAVLTGIVGQSLVLARHAVMCILPAQLSVFSAFYLLDRPWRRRAIAGWTVVVGLFCTYIFYDDYEPLAKWGDFDRVAAYLEKHEAPGDLILVVPADELSALDYYYDGRGILTTVPEAEDFETYEMIDYVIPSEEAIEEVVEASGWNGETLWLMRACGEPCGWLGVDFNVDLMENYVARKYELVSRHEFYGATLREFRPLPPEGIPPAARADSE